MTKIGPFFGGACLRIAPVITRRLAYRKARPILLTRLLGLCRIPGSFIKVRRMFG
jgi:hypothetical protein